jgi:2-octaprenyl-6-methoxyphenol hydroxylase
MVEQVDCIVAGGGLAGLSLALSLDQAGLATAVVDIADLPATLDPEFDGRASAVASASQRLLNSIGVWRHVGACQPILEIRVVDQDSPLFLHFDHADVSDEPLGFMVENRWLRYALLTEVAQRPSIQLFAPDHFQEVVRGPFGVEAHLTSGRMLRAPVIIGCEGRRSPLREAAGIHLAQWDYGQTAIIATVHHADPHGGIAHEIFRPEGPFAILPLSGNRSSIVWTASTAEAPAYLALPDRAFDAEIARRFGDFLGPIEIQPQRWSFPLAYQHADSYTAERLALVADAAHGIHPIAGQGLNMGWRDIAALTEVLVDAARLGLDIGSTSVLERYARWRRTDNVIEGAATDALNRLFATNFPPVRVARRLGLAAVNRMPPLKRLFMQEARGLVGKLPRLLKGEAV